MHISTKLAVIVQLSEDEARQVIQDLNPYVFNNDATNALFTQLEQALQEKQATAPLAQAAATMEYLESKSNARKTNTSKRNTSSEAKTMCEICGKPMKSMHALKIHMGRIHFTKTLTDEHTVGDAE